MATWDIEVAGCSRVMHSAADKAAEYEGDFTGLSDALAEMVGTLTRSELVAAGVVEFAERVATPHIAAVAGHTQSALLGTGDAVNFYLAGDEQMAAEAQRGAAQAEYPADLPGGASR